MPRTKKITETKKKDAAATAEPSPQPASAQTPLWRTFALLRGHEKKVAVLLALIVVAQGAGFVVPIIFKDLIDALTSGLMGGAPLSVSLLLWASFGVLVATVVGSLAQSAYNYQLFKLVTKIEDTLRQAAFQKYLELQALYHHGASSGQIIGRIERGGTSLYSILNDIAGQSLLPSLVTFFGAFFVLLFQNVWIAFAVLLPFPIYFLVTRNIANRIYEIEQRSNDAFEAVSKEMYDVAGNVLTVKKFSQEDTEMGHKRELMAKAREIQYGAERLWGVIDSIQTAISTVGRVVVLALSGWFVLQGEATIGQFVLFITLQNMAYAPLAQISNVLPRMRRNVTRVERMFSILDEQVTVLDKPNATELAPLSRALEFRNVSFGYRGDGEFALRNISVTIPAGKTVALVGRSGSGKTTFINLILRSYDPQEGAILFDGTDIRDVTQESVRRQIAVVPQEVDLFSRTVAENISYGKPDVSQRAIVLAAKTALAHDFIERLDKKYDTVVGERGIKLSGGERQRIGIARAVLRDPAILILDEATSHLDTESERFISSATDTLIKNRTSIIIAHRLSTVIRADTILVFNNGTIEASGAHDELLHISPTYARLHALQFVDDEHEVGAAPDEALAEGQSKEGHGKNI